MQVVLIIITLLLIGLIYFLLPKKKKKSLTQPEPGTEKEILESHVSFYRELTDQGKREFLDRVRLFLSKVAITPVETELRDKDRVLIAAAAIIPIFHFKNWEYRYIHEVLLYPDSFDHDFALSGRGRHILGMVGNGPMQNVMILSQQDLHQGFEVDNNKSNPAIHEFVHLLDKEDGDTDGVPAAFLPPHSSVPWLKRIHKEIDLIKKGESDINPYGATNEAEFLAVASEYFFEKPDQLEKRHPELFALLSRLFEGKEPENQL